MQQVKIKHNEATNGTVTVDWNDDDKTPSWKAHGEGSALLELTTNTQRRYLQVHATERGATSRTVMMTLDEPSAAAVVAKLAEMWGHRVNMTTCSNVLTDQIAASVAPMAEERETAQWYSAAIGEGAAVIATLPEETRKRCYQYGGLLPWNRLPVEAREPLRRKLAQNRAEAEAYERKRDAPAFRFALHLDLSAHDQPLTVIVSSLRDVAATVQSQALMFAQTRAIHDHNGENIGQWEVIEPEPAPAPGPGTAALRAELAALDALRDATAAVADAAERYIIGPGRVGELDDRRALENAIAARKDARARAMATRPQIEPDGET